MNEKTKWLIGLIFLSILAGNGYYQNTKIKELKSLDPDIYIDRETNTMWQNQTYSKEERNAFFNGRTSHKVDTWINAKTYCNKLTLNGMTDWELPNITVLNNIFLKKKNLKDYVLEPYWSSTTDYVNVDLALSINFGRYDVLSRKKESVAYIRCFRKINQQKAEEVLH